MYEAVRILNLKNYFYILLVTIAVYCPTSYGHCDSKKADPVLGWFRITNIEDLQISCLKDGASLKDRQTIAIKVTGCRVTLQRTEVNTKSDYVIYLKDSRCHKKVGDKVKLSLESSDNVCCARKEAKLVQEGWAGCRLPSDEAKLKKDPLEVICNERIEWLVK
ncbi:hypothetical protein DOM22_10870 [Bdellovibrio sp. ZAP7]|uniref:hypothetical protein n=1 Tax=Bdellovibrio sp. ZAP7 TaxID=2231053 RepID=UPI0011635084|nr:hypothetical protein [Bdellovibrio sp. ZAP7]QDK45613.1 hypothetical protein DOM22_10870 [Bdellovibrio sp. ZAP7]